MLANASGVQIGGVNIAIVGNDISNLPAGVNLFGQANYFNLVADNSIHNVAVGIQTLSTPYGPIPAEWVVGNSFRGNVLSATDGELYPDTQYECIGFGIGGESNAGTLSDSDDGLILMNVFEQNLVSGFDAGTAFFYQVDAQTGYTGIVDTVLANNFFLSNGEVNSARILTFFGVYSSLDIDPVPDFPLGNSNLWQIFANALNA